MESALVFFGIATLVGCLLRGVIALRRRSAARRPGVSGADVCQLEHARRITSVAITASLTCLALVGLVHAVL